MTLKWKSKILLGMIESTYGTDPTPQAANGILAKDVKWSPMEGNDVDRELELPEFGSTGTIPVNIHAKLSFMVELAPSGTAGVAPGWGPILRACGIAETIVATTSVTYNPITDDPESVTFYFQIERTLYAMVGARGTAKLEFTAGGLPYLNFEMTGLFVDPTEASRTTPTLTGFKKPQEVTTRNTPVFTINAQTLVMRQLNMTLGNAVEPRFLVNQEEILITDREGKVETTVNAVPLTTLNPYALAKEATEVPIVLTHGTGAGRIATLNVPKAQLQRPAGLENSQGITEWPLSFIPIRTNGNDQWTLTLT